MNRFLERTEPVLAATKAAADWLVVIDGREASLFRSLQPGAVPQVIRATAADRRVDARPGGAKVYLNGREHSRPPGFFEPLAGLLHQAGRILIFGPATLLGSEADAFVLWLRGNHPAIAQRLVASVAVEPREDGDAAWLARARVHFATKRA